MLRWVTAYNINNKKKLNIKEYGGKLHKQALKKELTNLSIID